MEITISDGGIDWPAWVQAVGSVLAIGVAIMLPRLDRSREERALSLAAMALARQAHREIAGTWLIATGQQQPDAVMQMVDMVPDLRRSVTELDAVPLTGGRSLQAVLYIRRMARCAEGVVDLAMNPHGGAAERVRRISNYAHHLLLLIWHELGRPGEAIPRPAEGMRDGVPPEILEAVDGLR